MDTAVQNTSTVAEWFADAKHNVHAVGLSTARTLLTVGLFIGGAYLIDSRTNTYAGLLFVGWSFSRVSAYALRAYRLSVGASLLEAVAATRANTRTDLLLRIDAIIGHPAVNAAFDRLKRLGRIQTPVTFAEWRDGLIRRYRAEHDIAPEDNPLERVAFEVRAGQLWKDGEYRQSPFIHHEVLIADESMKRESFLAKGHDGLRIRVLVINGVLKVQVGRWDEEFGHREPGQNNWIAWDTVTSFPLLLNPLDHYLSPRLLLMDYFSMPHHRKSWQREKRRFFRRVEEYRRVLGTWGEYGENSLATRQAKELEGWLKREGFQRTGGDDPPLENSWRNEFLQIEIHSVQVEFDLYRWLSDENEKYY
jgi:hypothetical protein